MWKISSQAAYCICTVLSDWMDSSNISHLKLIRSPIYSNQVMLHSHMPNKGHQYYLLLHVCNLLRDTGVVHFVEKEISTGNL